MISKAAPKDIDDYMDRFPADVQALLKKMRLTVRKAAPQATERISYGIPTFFLNGNLVHFAGYENHIGFYPGATGIAQFKQELSAYKSAKGSVQFPLDQPLPLALVSRIVKFRVQQSLDERKPKKK